MSRVLSTLLTPDVPVIYLAATSPPQSIVLPSEVLQSNSGGPPSAFGIRGLSTSEVHSPICHHTTGGLLHHLLTLTTLEKVAVVFFYTT